MDGDVWKWLLEFNNLEEDNTLRVEYNELLQFLCEVCPKKDVTDIVLWPHGTSKFFFCQIISCCKLWT